MYVSQMERNFKRKSEKGHHSEGYTIRRIEKDIKTVVHKLVLQSVWYKKKKKCNCVSSSPPAITSHPLWGPRLPTLRTVTFKYFAVTPSLVWYLLQIWKWI